MLILDGNKCVMYNNNLPEIIFLFIFRSAEKIVGLNKNNYLSHYHDELIKINAYMLLSIYKLKLFLEYSITLRKITE